MSLLSSPYLLVSVSFSSKTGVSMALAPWRSNTLSITCAGDKQAQNSSTAGYKSWGYTGRMSGRLLSGGDNQQAAREHPEEARPLSLD